MLFDFVGTRLQCFKKKQALEKKIMCCGCLQQKRVGGFARKGRRFYRKIRCLLSEVSQSDGSQSDGLQKIEQIRFHGCILCVVSDDGSLNPGNLILPVHFEKW